MCTFVIQRHTLTNDIRAAPNCAARVCADHSQWRRSHSLHRRKGSPTPDYPTGKNREINRA